MKISALAVSLLAASSLTAVAAPRLYGLADAVTELESRYPGKVVAIVLDDAGDKAAHYHVDMQFPGSASVRIDVDAATLAIESRDAGHLPAGSATLAEAAALLAGAIPGEILLAELDAATGPAAHYDVDVRLPQGAVARLKVDATTRRIDWRTPAVIAD